MEDLQIFSNSEFGEIRTITKDNEPMFCLADVCRILEIKNVSDCKSRLRQKGVVTTDTLTNGGKQKMVFIDESNLYKYNLSEPQRECRKIYRLGNIRSPSVNQKERQLQQAYDNSGKDTFACTGQ